MGHHIGLYNIEIRQYGMYFSIGVTFVLSDGLLVMHENENIHYNNQIW